MARRTEIPPLKKLLKNTRYPAKMSFMTDQELVDEIQQQLAVMIDVATGQAQISDVNDAYKSRSLRIRSALADRGINDPNPYLDLWRWYEDWKAKGFSAYRQRRAYIHELYDPLIQRLENLKTSSGIQVFTEPTGWEKVDRTIDGMRERLETANKEEEFQTVGLFCRETLISLAQEVFDPQRHSTADAVKPSKTDAKRMLDAFLAAELSGGANEEVRRHAKAALDLANALTHQRTANFRDAALCAEATVSVVNLVAIISGRRSRWVGADFKIEGR